jgi:hypothetical protein
MKVSISQAAKMAGVSRSHFYKNYLKNNAISVEEDRFGKKVIDKSEILRVFGKIYDDTSEHKKESAKEDIQGHVETENILLKQEIQFLKAQLEAAQEREKWFQTQITDITSSLKSLEDKRPKKRFWFFP